jgi:hypothetical protein
MFLNLAVIVVNDQFYSSAALSLNKYPSYTLNTGLFVLQSGAGNFKRREKFSDLA